MTYIGLLGGSVHSQHSKFAKALIVSGYGVGGLLALLASYVTYGVVVTAMFGKNLTGEMQATAFDYIFDIILLAVFWSHTGLALGVANDLRTMRHTDRCRRFARFLCFFVPLGTLLGSLTLIYLRRNGQTTHAA